MARHPRLVFSGGHFRAAKSAFLHQRDKFMRLLGARCVEDALQIIRLETITLFYKVVINHLCILLLAAQNIPGQIAQGGFFRIEAIAQHIGHLAFPGAGDFGGDQQVKTFFRRDFL